MSQRTNLYNDFECISHDSSMYGTHEGQRSISASVQTPDNVQSTLHSLAACVDRSLTRIRHCIRYRADNDAMLLFGFYATRLSSNLLENAGRVALVLSLLPSKGLVLKLFTRFADPLARRLFRVSKSSRAAQGMLAEVRAFGRLWGSIGVYHSIKRLAQTQTTSNTGAASLRGHARKYVCIGVEVVQSFLMLLFFLGDNASLLSRRNVLPLSSNTRAKVARWSLRSWALYTGIILFRVVIERPPSEDDESNLGWRKQLRRSLAWFLIAMHNSAATGPLNDFIVSLLGFYASASKVEDLWQNSVAAHDENPVATTHTQ